MGINYQSIGGQNTNVGCGMILTTATPIVTILIILNKSQYAQWNLNEMKILSKRPSQGERACTRGSEYNLFEILD